MNTENPALNALRHHVTGAIERGEKEAITEQAAPVKKLTKRDKEKLEARESLLRFIKPGDTIYTILRHVSASGMSRDISIVVIGKDGETYHPNYSVAKLLGERIVNRNGHDAIRVSGCGMDMGFHLVYSLGYSLWPKGTEKPHGTRNGEPDSCGGYALNHAWL